MSTDERKQEDPLFEEGAFRENILEDDVFAAKAHDAPGGFDASYFEKELIDKDAVIESFAATIQQLTGTIEAQYTAMKNLGDKIYDVVKENNALSKTIMDNTENYPILLDGLIERIDAFSEAQSKHFGWNELETNRYVSIKNALTLISDDMKKIKASLPRRGSGYTEERTNSFGPGGSNG